MAFIVEAESPPLREDETGGVRIGDTRVLLELVIRAFEDGATPEAIVHRYETLSLSDVYAVIAFYLRHSEEVRRYLARREQAAAKMQQQTQERNGDLSDIRERLLARRQMRG